jgi:hypothetical protein
MLPFDDNRWLELEAGYRHRYDPRPALQRLRANDVSAWAELWNMLHHQGDVGVASYAAVPHLVQIHQERDVADWQTYALIGTIEICRTRGRNPMLPDWLAPAYLKAWDNVVVLACHDLPRANDETTVRPILGALALSKALRPLGEIMLHFTADELAEMIQLYSRA